MIESKKKKRKEKEKRNPGWASEPNQNVLLLWKALSTRPAQEKNHFQFNSLLGIFSQPNATALHNLLLSNRPKYCIGVKH